VGEEAEEYNYMTQRATEDILGQLHGLIAQGFIDKFKSGEATTADYTAAIKFLKDNNINCVGQANDTMKELVDELPVFDDTMINYGPDYDPQFASSSILRTH
jgi:hypothetical protein